jgi:hypothetical protein
MHSQANIEYWETFKVQAINSNKEIIWCYKQTVYNMPLQEIGHKHSFQSHFSSYSELTKPKTIKSNNF